jgi:hypothetical protein
MSRGKSAFYVDRAGCSPGAHNAACGSAAAPLVASGENSVWRSRAWPAGNAGAWRRDLIAGPYAVLSAAGVLHELS